MLKLKGRVLRIGIRMLYFYQFRRFYKKIALSKFGNVLNKVTPDVKKRIEQKFTRAYLATFISLEQRIIFNSSHYHYIDEHLTDSFFRQINKGIVLWGMDCDTDAHQIVLTIPHGTSAEGDLLLEYRFNNKVLHQLTFSFIEGQLMGMEQKQLVFIGGSQGRLGKSESIRIASKQNREISPSTALVIALKAISKTLAIENITGVKAEHHISMQGDPCLKGQHSYNQLWLKNYGIETALFYVMPTHASPSESEPVAGSHASRTRRKRKNRQNLLTVIELGFATYVSSQVWSSHYCDDSARSEYERGLTLTL